jgi:uncharacterized lipoprotein
MIVKITLCSLLLLFISGCSTLNQSVERVKTSTVDMGKTLGLLDSSTMQIPDYYSTYQLQRKYEFGRLYHIDEIECSLLSNRCK